MTTSQGPRKWLQVLSRSTTKKAYNIYSIMLLLLPNVNHATYASICLVAIVDLPLSSSLGGGMGGGGAKKNPNNAPLG